MLQILGGIWEEKGALGFFSGNSAGTALAAQKTWSLRSSPAAGLHLSGSALELKLILCAQMCCGQCRQRQLSWRHMTSTSGC